VQGITTHRVGAQMPVHLVFRLSCWCSLQSREISRVGQNRIARSRYAYIHTVSPYIRIYGQVSYQPKKWGSPKLNESYIVAQLLKSPATPYNQLCGRTLVRVLRRLKVRVRLLPIPSTRIHTCLSSLCGTLCAPLSPLSLIYMVHERKYHLMCNAPCPHCAPPRHHVALDTWLFACCALVKMLSIPRPVAL